MSCSSTKWLGLIENNSMPPGTFDILLAAVDEGQLAIKIFNSHAKCPGRPTVCPGYLGKIALQPAALRIDECICRTARGARTTNEESVKRDKNMMTIKE